MKTFIDSEKGVHTHANDKGISLEGKDYHEAPFDDRWDDLRAVISEGSGPAALTFEQYRDTDFFMRFFRHNQQDKIYMTYQMPHGWNTSKEVRPHMHFIPMSSGSGIASFNYAYTWANINEEFSNSTGWISGSVQRNLAPSNQYIHSVISFVSIQPPQSAKASSILIFKVERNQQDDTYETSKDHGTAAANVAILEFDLHYQQLSAGTETEFV